MSQMSGGQIFRIGFWFGAGFLAAGVGLRLAGHFALRMML